MGLKGVRNKGDNGREQRAGRCLQSKGVVNCSLQSTSQGHKEIPLDATSCASRGASHSTPQGLVLSIDQRTVTPQTPMPSNV